MVADLVCFWWVLLKAPSMDHYPIMLSSLSEAVAYFLQPHFKTSEVQSANKVWNFGQSADKFLIHKNRQLFIFQPGNGNIEYVQRSLIFCKIET